MCERAHPAGPSSRGRSSTASPVGLGAEPEVLVERERPVVGLLGVDQHRAAPLAAAPVERVDHQRGADAAVVAVGVHGQALQVAEGAGPPRDGVADDAPSDVATRNRASGVAVRASAQAGACRSARSRSKARPSRSRTAARSRRRPRRRREPAGVVGGARRRSWRSRCRRSWTVKPAATNGACSASAECRGEHRAVAPTASSSSTARAMPRRGRREAGRWGSGGATAGSPRHEPIRSRSAPPVMVSSRRMAVRRRADDRSVLAARCGPRRRATWAGRVGRGDSVAA